MSKVTFITEWNVSGQPDGIAISANGEVFVNINNNHRIVKYNTEGELLAEWSSEGESRGIAVSQDGEVFSVNNLFQVVKSRTNGDVSANINNSHHVLKYSDEGKRLADWRAEGEAAGIAISPHGEIFVNINNSHRIVKYSTEGELLAELSYEGDSGGIAVGSDGEIFSITDVPKVVKQSTDGNLLAEWSVVAGVIESNGIVVSPDNEVFVNINNSHRVAKYSSDGELLLEWGGKGNQPGEFISPSGVSIGPNELVYVADKGNNRIQVFHCP